MDRTMDTGRLDRLANRVRSIVQSFHTENTSTTGGGAATSSVNVLEMQVCLTYCIKRVKKPINVLKRYDYFGE